MTHEAFVSYAHDDKTVADDVCTKLEASAIPCWIAPRDTLAGVTYPGQIVDAIATSRVLVLILSSHSMQSRQVRSEVERAFTKGIPIVPLRIEDVLPEGDLEYLIGSVNWLDALIPPIEPRLDELVTVVRRILSGEIPAKAELRTNPSNLPAPVNRLIGRDHDIADIHKRLSDHRLVTITGSGGVGKTRVALEVGRSLLSAYRDGVWFVPLAALSDPALVPNAVAQALAVPEGQDRQLTEMLLEHVKKKHLLLILDNCEHVVAEAAGLGTAILEGCPEIQLLATSREHLNIDGEWTYRLPSLSVPRVNSPVDLNDLGSAPAIDLFVERARATESTFVLSPDDAPVVAEICRRLDGIPFAVELAAARVDALTPRQISQRLDERFDILTGGGRTALQRQQTMRACIDWSYDLLSDSEKALFRRIAIFPNGSTLVATESVCVDEQIPSKHVVDLISALVSKSLVTHQARDRSRFHLLESTREYAFERLSRSGEAAAVARRHAQWVATFVHEAFAAGATVPLQRSLTDILPEVASIRAALTWALSYGNDSRLGARVAGEAQRLWFEGGLQADGRHWIELALSRIDEDAEPEIAAHLWRALGEVSNGKKVVEAAERAVRLYERIADLEGSALAHVLLASGLWQVGRLAAAETAIDRALALQREVGLDRTWHYGNALDTKGYILLNDDRLADAHQAFNDALTQCIAEHDEHGAARTQGNIAELEFAMGQSAAALHRARAAASTFRRLGAAAREATAIINAAAYQLDLGDIDGAAISAKEGLALASRINDLHLAVMAIQHLAVVASARREPQRAAKLLGYVDAWCASEGYERDRGERISRDRLMQLLQTEVDTDMLSQLTTAGARMSQDDAAALGAAEPPRLFEPPMPGITPNSDFDALG